MRGGYHAKRFWDKWAKTFMNDPWQVAIHPQHEWLLEKLRELSPKSILEVGCGFGRNVKFLRDSNFLSKTIVGVDISKAMLDKAKVYLQDNKIKLIQSSADNIPFENKSFDCVFTHGLLMHVASQNIDKSLSEIVRVAKKNIILIEQNYGGNEYTFIHNYKSLLKKYPVNIIEYNHDTKLGLDLIYVKVR